jgi:S-adenosylmethionine:tRNA ribosyltransferase-isomerase
MKRSDFYYDLPEELVAQYPSAQRSASRLLVLKKGTGKISHHIFTELPQFLQKNDLLVFNNTRVFPARLYGQKKTGGKIEILIERLQGSQEALAHVRSSHAPKADTIIELDQNQRAIVTGRENDLFKLFFPDTQDLLGLLKQIGHIPLPPYIQRSDEESDIERYQTIYGQIEGSVAAPTAGLHYDEKMIATLREKGVELGYVTLHVGGGTFKPVRVENITDHQMHTETIEVDEIICEQIRQTKKRGGRIIAAGTTAARALESASQSGEIQPYTGETDIFIYPGYTFKCIDALQTNFHLPESTLIMLVSALAGYENTMQAYQIAVQEKYRFFSYGDTMLII